MKTLLTIALLSATLHAAHFGLKPYDDEFHANGVQKYARTKNGYSRNICEQAIAWKVDQENREWKQTDEPFFHTSVIGRDVVVYAGDALKLKTPIGEYARLEYVCIFNLVHNEATVKQIWYKGR